jgi:uncharacterized LabA/DUF88 family protein
MKTAIFIDGANMFTPLKALNLRIDYDKLTGLYTDAQPTHFNTCLISYYTAIYEDEETGLDKMRAFMDWLQYHGVRLVTKQSKSFKRKGEQFIKGNLDVNMAVDAIRFASWADQMIFFTGDDDFVPVLRMVRELGVTAGVCAHQVLPGKGINNTFNQLGDDLRRECDFFWNINDPNSFCHTFIGKENKN